MGNAPEKKPNRVMLTISKCQDCPKQECPHRQLAGFIPDECPKIAATHAFFGVMQDVSRMAAITDMIQNRACASQHQRQKPEKPLLRNYELEHQSRSYAEKKQ